MIVQLFTYYVYTNKICIHSVCRFKESYTQGQRRLIISKKLLIRETVNSYSNQINCVIIEMMTLYKSLVRSLLDYCCPLWNPTKVQDIQLIEGVQRTCTSSIGGLMAHFNYWERLAKLKPVSLQRRRERCIILMM